MSAGDCSRGVLGHCQLVALFFCLFKKNKTLFQSVRILLQWHLAENEVFYPVTFVEAGVRADLRGYFSFRDGISPHTPISGTWKRLLHGFENVTRA